MRTGTLHGSLAVLFVCARLLGERCCVVAIDCMKGSREDGWHRDGPDSKDHLDLQIDGKSVPLYIAAGPRPTDRIIAHMVRLIFVESLGLPDVRLYRESYSYAEWLRALNWTMDEFRANSTRPMLHVGLAETTNGRRGYSANVVSVGELGPRLRLGWFAPAHKIPAAPTGPSADHWRYFTQRDLAKKFELDDRQEQQVLRSTTIADDTGKRWCDSGKFPECGRDGRFVPEQCKYEACATLLAGFPHESYELLVNQIKEFKVYVKVAWLGNRLDRTVLRFRGENVSVLFFDFAVSALTKDASLVTEVLFPACDTNGHPKGCSNQSAKLRKLISRHLKDNARHVYRLMELLQMSKETLNKVLDDYSFQRTIDEETLQSQACTLLFSSWDEHKTWVDKVLYQPWFVHTILPSENSSIGYATLLALDSINIENILPGFYINQTLSIGNCDSKTVVDGYQEWLGRADHRIVAVVGPDCNGSLSNLVGIASYHKHPVFSYSADSVTANNRTISNNLFRVPPDTSIMSAAYAQLFKEWEWTSVIFLSETEATSDSFKRSLDVEMTRRGIKLLDSHLLMGNDDPFDTLQRIKATDGHIIMANFREATGARILCAAAKLQMTSQNDYVWLLPPWFSEGWHSKPELAQLANCTELELAHAVNHSLAYRFDELADDSTAIDVRGKTVLNWRESLHKLAGHVSPNSGFANDAVLALADSLKTMGPNTFITGPRPNDTQWFEAIRNTRIMGVTGNVSFVNNIRPAVRVDLYQYVSGKYTCIGHFSHIDEQPCAPTEAQARTAVLSSHQHTKQRRHGTQTKCRIVLYDGKTIWPNGARPRDGVPICELEAVASALAISCKAAKMIVYLSATVLGVLLLVLVCGGLAHRHYERRVKLIEQSKQQSQHSPFDSLSEYELPEDSVRIYRSLGEGAFGKVYLGEYLKAEGCIMPIAVKAAKDPKNMNAKMELLSEAEVMKRFEHVNILRLIGVVTQNNKCQIVTEFMMYGNLKSYLQDRRHLAVKGEIDASHLTRMALDISRGLSYLASLNYVHGDLACRNCLVHETLMIKIADFGFCKNLVDQDYYRLVRSGVMPIRWMSPELLSTGVYHVQSDVWSFGIVLYEIITFGSCPYSHLDDHKVQDYIRQGGFPALPQKVSSQLEALFLRIWAPTKEDRPTALELFETLAANPTLVHPSLEDGPSRLDYISLEARGRTSRGSASARPWTSSRKSRSPAQRVRYSVGPARVKLDIL